jgi:pimeloyl-ACP methyl ester carboxylesterase
MSFSEEIKSFEKEYPYQTIRVGRACFRYILAGQAESPAVVLLNGGMNCSEMWHAYVRALSRSCRVLAFDYPRELASAEETVDAIAQLMEKLGIDRAVLAGASFGGLMAQLIAKRYPQKVRGLGLFSTAALTEATIKKGRKKYRGYKVLLWVMKRKHLNYEKLKPKLIAASMKQTEQESEENRRYIQEMLESMFKDYPKEKDVHITGMMVGLMETKPCRKEDFAYLNGNVAMMFPEKDFFSKEEQQELIDTFPRARIEYVQNGHFGTVLEWERYVEVIERLVQKAQTESH